VNNGVDINGTSATAVRLVDGCVKPDAHSLDGAEDEAQLGACMAALDLDGPLAANADAFGECRLVELELPAPVANKGAEVSSTSGETTSS
jgi:hypothetical protein